tara:strand:- start:853 stop:1524 length:672 start_codon:yes stop_codon:yes gene_type:complete
MFAQLTKSDNGFDLPIVKTGNAARMANGQISAGGVQSLDADALKNNYGIVKVETVHATLGKYQREVESARELDGAVYRISYRAADVSLERGQAEALNEIANRRHAIETGGVIVDTKFYSTDRDSQAAIARASGTVNWKCNGTVTRDIEQEDGSTVATACVSAVEFADSDMDAVGTAVAEHVAAAYAREAALMSAINAADSVAALRAIDLTAGWASVPPPDPGE